MRQSKQVSWPTATGEVSAAVRGFRKESPYDEMLNLVSDGQIIAWPIPDDTKLKGIRIGIARRASQHFDLSVQFKYDASKKILAIRLAPEKPDQPRGRGRPPVKK